MKVSIVIPVYNGEKYIAECIESCLSQKHKDIEIIIVDDGSTDQTSNIICGYRENHKDKITVIHKENGGTASALNRGMEFMTGDWFKWLSADDVLYPNTISHMIAFIENTDIDTPYKYLYYTHYDVVDNNGKHIRQKIEPDRNNLTQEERAAQMYHGFYGNGSTSLIHISALHIVGKFQEGMKLNDDYEFWLRWCLKFKFDFVCIPIIGIKYRVHGESLSNKVDEMHKANLQIREKYHSYLTKDQLDYIYKIKIPLRRKLIPYSIRRMIVRLRDR